jgi:hypothetical protein
MGRRSNQRDARQSKDRIGGILILNMGFLNGNNTTKTERRIMKNPQFILAATITLLSGCTTLQTVNKLEAGKVNTVCIAEHKEVRETVLETIEEGLSKHGVKYRVIPGSYVMKNNLWVPTFQIDQSAGCDAVLFYVANWNWDVTMYMKFANVWMATPDSKTRLGGASYDARASLNKFINAHDKIIELVDGLFNDYQSTNTTKAAPVGSAPIAPVQPTASGPAVLPAPTAAPVAAPTTTVAAVPAPAPVVPKATSATSQKLRELQELRKDGVITEEDFNKKKKQLLDQM